MTDQSEERAAASKAAIEAMKSAKANMATVLERVANLESALSSAIGYLKDAKSDISPKVYCYQHSGSVNRTVHSRIDDQVAALSKVL